MITLSVWLWTADQYTVEIGILVALLTLLWLIDK